MTMFVAFCAIGALIVWVCLLRQQVTQLQARLAAAHGPIGPAAAAAPHVHSPPAAPVAAAHEGDGAAPRGNNDIPPHIKRGANGVPVWEIE